MVHDDGQKNYIVTLDDDPMMNGILARVTGMNSLPFKSTKALLGRAESYNPMAAFIDVHLDPGESGLDAIAQLRKYWPYSALFVMTTDPNPKLIGDALALGANDFVRKPIEKTELCARLQARMREMQARKSRDCIEHGDFLFSKDQKLIRFQSKSEFLPDIESRLLLVLLENRELVISRADLMHQVWGHIKVANNTLDKKISRLRGSLTNIAAPIHVESVYGAGIKLSFEKAR